MADKQTFETVLEKHPEMAATGITIPFDVDQVFGAKRVPVIAVINGAEYRGSIVRMGGRYMLGIPKAFREAAKIAAGDNIVVTVERDTGERTVEVPADLALAISDAGLKGPWDALSYTHRKEHARAVTDAKRPETRILRTARAVEMLANKAKN